MTPRYRWLLFDADGTLFDYDAAEKDALERTFAQFALPIGKDTADAYRAINQQLWQALERREVTPQALKVERFRRLFAATGVRADAAEFGLAYLDNLAEASHLMAGAREVIADLRGVCRFAIITNGLSTVQRGRISRAAIRDDIAALIISEEIGAAKPAAAIFDAAFAAMGHPARSDVLVIGDSLSSDMQGACDYGVDACWFNPGRLPRPARLPIRYEIGDLREISALVRDGKLAD
jgi:2-haloacid dehalogenase